MTFILLAYNAEPFVGEAVEGALRQTYEPLEILVSDDASTDSTFDVARRVVEGYRGPHRVRLLRNAENLGVSAHLSHVAAQANGEWLVLAAGDDVSLPPRVERIMSTVRGAGDPLTAVFSSAEVIDETGAAADPRIMVARPPTLSTAISMSAGVLGATSAVRRSVLEFFGPLDANVVYDDVVLCVRALLLGDAKTIDEVLVRYRRHEGAQSAGGYGKTGAALTAHHTRVTLDQVRVYANILRDLGTFAARRGVGDDRWREAMRATAAAISERDAWLDVIVGDSVATMVTRQLAGVPRRLARSVRLWLPLWLQTRRQGHS